MCYNLVVTQSLEERLALLLRSALLSDLGACLELDADSQTDHVWQMDEREENGGRVVRFQTVRLPRVMHVSYPRQRDDLMSAWEGESTILVTADRRASEEDAEPPRVLAFCQLDVSSWQEAGWISHLIVDRPHRRKGIATAMLQASVLWARKEGLRRLLIGVQTKNYPAICFCEKNGFVFCGFNDRYYRNRDIALFFSLRV
jgi:GNAT superfamily N-acetyltransferase